MPLTCTVFDMLGMVGDAVEMMCSDDVAIEEGVEAKQRLLSSAFCVAVASVQTTTPRYVTLWLRTAT